MPLSRNTPRKGLFPTAPGYQKDRDMPKDHKAGGSSLLLKKEPETQGIDSVRPSLCGDGLLSFGFFMAH